MTGRVIGPQERVDVRQALWLHSMGSAYAAHEKRCERAVEAGKSADLIVWSDDIYSIPADKIRHLKAELTIVNGQAIQKPSDTDLQMMPGREYLSSDSAQDFMVWVRTLMIRRLAAFDGAVRSTRPASRRKTRMMGPLFRGK